MKNSVVSWENSLHSPQTGTQYPLLGSAVNPFEQFGVALVGIKSSIVAWTAASWESTWY